MTTKKPSKATVVSVTHCSACGNNHQKVFFRRMQVPKVENGVEYWYYGMCPVEMSVIYMTEDKGT
jgi:alkylhydroperoxidase family enzyme